MFAKLLAATSLTIALAQLPAQAGPRERPDGARDVAVNACVDINGYAPAKMVEAVEDGLGDWLVWVEDTDGDLWMCNANADGAVYANVFIEGDLLKGEGADVITYEPAQGRREEPRHASSDPAQRATELCALLGDGIEDMKVVATVEDGLGDYLVWLQNTQETFWVCNASADAELYVFEPVNYPIEEDSDEFSVGEDRIA